MLISLLDSHVFPIVSTAMPPISFTTKNIRKQVVVLCRYKSAGPNGIYPAIFNPLAGVLTVPLATLCEKSLLDRRLPSDWKTATVTPIHKGGASNSVFNYGPTSLTSGVIKVMERLIRERIASHLASSRSADCSSTRVCGEEVLFHNSHLVF